MIQPALAIASYAGSARAEEHMVLVDKIDVQSTKGIATFDISFVDPRFNLYVLADRTNASVDLFKPPSSPGADTISRGESRD